MQHFVTPSISRLPGRLPALAPWLLAGVLAFLVSARTEGQSATPRPPAKPPAKPAARPKDSATADYRPAFGFLDTITPDGFAMGWAIDADAMAKEVEVVFTLDGPNGASESALANLPRPDLNKGGYPGNHGFRFEIPNPWRDGKKHRLYAFARELGSSRRTALKESPREFSIVLHTAPPSLERRDAFGFVDLVSVDGVVSGWAMDGHDLARPVTVEFTFDGEAKPAAGKVPADRQRADLNTAGYPGDHGFRFEIPREWRDGKRHEVYIFVRELSGARRVALKQSPKVFTIGVGSIGYLDKITPDGLALGWAVDPSTPGTSIDVEFALEARGSSAAPTVIGTVVAGSPRPDINTAGYPGNHGFVFSIPVAQREGKPHKLLVSAISSVGKERTVLSNSPQEFTLSQAPVPEPTKTVARAGAARPAPATSRTLRRGLVAAVILLGVGWLLWELRR